MDKKQIESEMLSKYGFNRGYIAEGCYHTSPRNIICQVKSKWSELTEQERIHMSGIYTYPAGCFEIKSSGDFDLSVKTTEQLTHELWLQKGCLGSLDEYKYILQTYESEMTDMDKEILAREISLLEIKKGIKERKEESIRATDQVETQIDAEPEERQ